MSHSLTLPTGYRFAAVACGVRPDRDRLDLAIVVSDRPASAAGVFTQNRVAAAPVMVSREHVPAADARGFVVCAGNANACTGDAGLDDARRMAALAAPDGVRPEQMLVASTGVIGRPLPMANVEAGIAAATGRLAATADAFDAVTRSILTTDTRPKVSSRSLGPATVLGFAKGAAMIAPNMATMLAFILTDATVEPAALDAQLRTVADATFNRISIDGHTSTNDTVLAFANGLHAVDPSEFADALTAVCRELALAIVDDAEGGTKRLTVEVEGLTDVEAAVVARSVAESPLVKAAIYGADPNWGRVVSAAGYSGVPFDERDLSCEFNGIELYRVGEPVPFDAAAVAAAMRSRREVEVRLRFARGNGRATVWASDLTPEYVRLNADYTT